MQTTINTSIIAQIKNAEIGQIGRKILVAFGGCMM
jgi:hypothetical protein